MIDQTTDYDAPSVYLPRLIEWADQAEARFIKQACGQVRLGFASNAEAYTGLAGEYREIAERARARLVDLSELTIADVQAADEPPSTLVELTDWLRNKLSRDFPLMRPELWQALACVLRPFRRQP